MICIITASFDPMFLAMNHNFKHAEDGIFNKKVHLSPVFMGLHQKIIQIQSRDHKGNKQACL